MTNGIDILLALAAIMAALEVVLFVMRGFLLRADQAQRLQRQVEEAQDEVRQIKERAQARQAELTAARSAAETALGMLRQASREFNDGQRPKEVLVHRLGDSAETRFRASLRKTLPDMAEENQALFWSYENFVDVGASSAQGAHDIAARHFAAKAGYELGSFEPVVRASPPAQDRAAGVAA